MGSAAITHALEAQTALSAIIALSAACRREAQMTTPRASGEIPAHPLPDDACFHEAPPQPSCAHQILRELLPRSLGRVVQVFLQFCHSIGRPRVAPASHTPRGC